MAEKIGGAPKRSAAKTGANPKVTHLPTRAARGAGASKPKRSAAALKPATPKARGAAAPDETDLRAALQERVIGLRVRHRDIDVKLEAHREAGKELLAKRKEIRDAIHKSGVPLHIFDEQYNAAGTTRVDLERNEQIRDLVREAFGLPLGGQSADLFKKKTPAAAIPATYWEAEGYRLGIEGLNPEPPAGMPPENLQDLMRGYHQSQARNAAGLKRLEEDVKTPAQVQTEATDEAAADLEDADQARLDAEQPDQATAEANGFEASADELALQAGRKAVIEGRAAETPATIQ